jgi:hypothetical protein
MGEMILMEMTMILEVEMIQGWKSLSRICPRRLINLLARIKELKVLTNLHHPIPHLERVEKWLIGQVSSKTKMKGRLW